jgi:hypothetical protein
MIALLLGVVIAVLALIYIAYSTVPTFQVDLVKELAKTLLQLVLIGIVGVFAKHLFDRAVENQRQATEELQHKRDLEEAERQRTRARDEAEHKALVTALDSLTTNYWQIKKALHIIAAHRSAKSYGEQMRQIIDFRLQLQRLDNEISAGMYPLIERQGVVTQSLLKLDSRLGDLTDEWRVHYWRLARVQERDEKIEDPEKKQVPGEIDKLLELEKIREDNFKDFHQLFENAANEIRRLISIM